MNEPSDFPGPHQCEARTGWNSNYHLEYVPVRCKRSIGVVWFEDASGVKRYHCPIPEHRRQLARTWGERVMELAGRLPEIDPRDGGRNDR